MHTLEWFFSDVESALKHIIQNMIFASMFLDSAVEFVVKLRDIFDKINASDLCKAKEKAAYYKK